MPDWVGGWVRALGFPLFSLSPDPPDLLELLIKRYSLFFSHHTIEERVLPPIRKDWVDRTSEEGGRNDDFLS